MVNGTKALLNLSQAAQALALAGESLKFAKKKNKKVKGIVGLGITNIVGIKLIKTQADIGATL